MNEFGVVELELMGGIVSLLKEKSFGLEECVSLEYFYQKMAGLEGNFIGMIVSGVAEGPRKGFVFRENIVHDLFLVDENVFDLL